MSNDVANYMSHHNLRNAVVMGHSMGGKTAMQLSVTYPELVDKLIVADIAPKFYPPHHQPIIDALLTLDFTQISSRKQADEALSQNLSDFGIRQFLLKNLYWVEQGKLGLPIQFGRAQKQNGGDWGKRKCYGGVPRPNSLYSWRPL